MSGHSGLSFSQRFSRAAAYGLRELLLAVTALVTLYPIYYIFSNSLKSRPAYAENPLAPPYQPVLYNFVQVFRAPNFLRWFLNSALLTASTAVLCLLISALGAFALSRMRFRGRKVLTNASIALMVIPEIVMIIPLFVLMARVRLVNTYPSAIIIYTGMFLPFAMYLLRSFFITVPQALIESALIDCCGSLRIFATIVLPLSRPILLSLFVVCSLYVWNELLVALIFLQREQMRTLMVGLALFQGRFSINTPLIMAGMAVATAPMLILYGFCQRYLIRGLIAGSLAGE
jgi:ABC-type glycerol-3-phosphate transport system permease component